MSGDGVKTAKPWFKSKTLWVNAIATGVAVADQITPIIPAAYAPHAATAVFLANAVLRLLTTQPVVSR